MPACPDHAWRAASTIVLAALFLLGQREAHAQQANLSIGRNLDFGSFVAGSGGTVVLSPSGLRTRTGGVILLNSVTVGQAIVNVGRTGSGSDKGASVSLPPDGSVRLTNGANSMAVNLFISSPATPVMPSVPAGGATLSVGATLVVPPNQPPGAYTGTFNVTVDLN